MRAAKKSSAVTVLIVQSASHGRFEVRDGLLVLGTSQNEMMAVWSAVAVAEEMTKVGQVVRVVRVIDGREIEEWPNPLLEIGLRPIET